MTDREGFVEVPISVIDDLLELCNSGIAYTSDYFRDKWGMDEEFWAIEARLKEAGYVRT